MIVERIRKLDINNRPILTGIYGCTFGQEFFMEDDLCKYNLWQELYRYLRSEGYTTVFYNEPNNFYSYEESQLETLFFKKPEEISNDSQTQDQYISPIASPNGKNRLKGIRLTSVGDKVCDKTVQGATSAELVSHNPGILVKKTVADQFFQLQSREQAMDRLFGFMDANPGHKLAIVFTMPSIISFNPKEEQRLLSELQERYSKQRHAGSGLRLLVLYDFNEVTQLYENIQCGYGFFYNNWIKDQLFPDYQDSRSDLHNPWLFRIGKMEKDEVGNVLKSRQINEGLNYSLSPIPFDELCARISRQFMVQDPETEEVRSIETVAEFMNLTVDEVERAILKMEEEKAANKLKKMLGIGKLVAQFEKYRMAYHYSQKNKNAQTFRPHMAFMGNPGTGKTTVARLFGEILHEDGLLPQGQFVEATVGDLVGQYIGQTRVKARAVCDRARGGVLFIDEAYGLMSGVNAHGNANFGQEAIEVLIQFMEDNDDSLVILAGYPDEIKKLINEGNPGFRSRFNESLGYFYFEDFGDEEQTEAATADDENDLLNELDNLVGLEDVKETLRKIIATIKRDKIRHQEGYPVERELNLNFLFMGNPGTGKTTVARMLGKILHAYGILPTDEVKLYTIDMILDKYVGGTLKNVTKMFDESCGGVLFIDDVYMLTNNTFGMEALHQILVNITDPKYKGKMAVVMAGYTNQINQMLKSNPGLNRRFEHKILFKDYTNDELTEIFRRKLQAEGFSIDKDGLARARAYFSALPRNKSFGNAREAVNLLQKVKVKLAKRLCKKTDASQEEVSTILPEDFPDTTTTPSASSESNAKTCLSIAVSRPAKTNRGDSKPTLSNAKEQLRQMPGMEKVVAQIERVEKNVLKFRQQKDEDAIFPVYPHLVFIGNPGTGKSMAAKLVATWFHEAGIISKDTFISVTPYDLIAQYIGQTAPKTKGLCEKALGGVLFIDEAYELFDDGGSITQEAVDVLLQYMTKPDFMVILAGYKQEMINRLRQEAYRWGTFLCNDQIILFNDFSPKELTKILNACLLLQTEEFKESIHKLVEVMYALHDEHWGNARTMQHLAMQILDEFLNDESKMLDVNHIPEEYRNLLDNPND